MYGLPKDFDGGFLVGHILEMVCAAKFQVYFHFDGKITISVESAFSYKTDEIIAVPAQNLNVLELLGSSIRAATGDQNGTLSLYFDNGHMLRIYDTSRQYESYTISYDGGDIIV